jgi:RimJ/RimL family protein N-acetyltransferase
VNPDDYRFLHAVETSEQLGPRWRFRGTTPSPEQWAQVSWSTTLAQFMVIGRQTDAPVGIVAVHQPDFQDGHAKFSAARFDPGKPSPAMMLGLALFLDYVFGCWNFRKLYMEVPEYNYEQMASGSGSFFEVEGRLRDHYYFSGRYWDQLILAVHRHSWIDRSAAVLRVARDQ